VQPMAGSSTVETTSAFYFDLASPLAYLVAERILQVLPGPVEWQPVLARELSNAESVEAYRAERVTQPAAGRRAGPLFFDRTEEEVFRSETERLAQAQGLQPLKWPSPFPFDSTLAMRAATYAKSIGRTVPFAQAAFRQAFAGGRSLGELDNVLIAAAACEMHPTAVLKGAELDSIHAQLNATTAAAALAGVSDVPAVRLGAHVFVGENALEQAVAA